MLKKVCAERVVATDGGWVALDAADLGLIESVYKKNIREGEERLMLAVLESAVEDFQKYVQLVVPALVNGLFGPTFAAKIEGPIPEDKVNLRILTPAGVRIKPCYCDKEKKQ
jgi:hypothetical protein